MARHPIAPEHLRTVVRERLVGRYPVFRRRAVAGPLPGTGWWVDDPDFDLDRHLRVGALPAPGDRAALERFVAVLGRRHRCGGRSDPRRGGRRSPPRPSTG